MADEQAATPEVAETAPVASPPPAAPAVDEEKEQLRREATQAKQALGEVADMVKSGKLKLAEDSPVATPEMDDTALVDHGTLKKREQEMIQRVAGALQQQTTVSAKMTRANTMDLMKGQLKNFDKYKTEIDAILDKVPDPIVAANPNTIKQAYQVVRAQHLDEEIEAEVAARGANRSVDDEDEEGFESPAPSRIPGAMASPVRSPAAPMGDASMRQSTGRRGESSIKPLSRDEKVAASLFGITSAEEFRKYGDRNWKPDLLGSKGRQRF